MKIHFLGADDGVTGSRLLVDSAGSRSVLDCGLFQGWKAHRERNWAMPEARQPPRLLPSRKSAAGVHPRRRPAGAVAEPGRQGRRLVFSGDVGRQHDLLMPPPEPINRADLLLVESTYGNRTHLAEDGAARLADIAQRTMQRGGSVLMPAFAVGRAQALLLVLQRRRRLSARTSAKPSAAPAVAACRSPVIGHG